MSAIEIPTEQEVLVFSLGGEEYAVDILKVREIRGYENITRVAGTPEFIRGVTNLRGEIVPIVDLRLKFGLGGGAIDEQTVVIVFMIGERIVGAVVDGVSDVQSLSEEQIKPAPAFGGGVDTAYFQSLASVDDRMLILLDIEALMTSRDMALIDDVEDRV